MATQPIGAESAHVIKSEHFPPAAAARIAANLLNRHSAHEIAEAITVMIDVLDFLGGDPDEETEDPDLESDGDDKDAAWLEWNTLRGSQRRGPNILASQNEDDEDDDPAEEDDDDSAIDDGSCDEPFQDLEPDEDEHAHPAYELDQSKGPLPPHLANDRALRRPFVERARREICRRLPYADVLGRTHRIEEA